MSRPASPTATEPPLSVLLVDDNRDAVDSMALFLALSDRPVRVAYSGPDALRLAAEVPPDVVVLDLWMPGMTGWEVAERLTVLFAPPPLLVAVSGCQDDASRERSRAAGIQFHFDKPVDPFVITRLVAWADARKRGAARPEGPPF